MSCLTLAAQSIACGSAPGGIKELLLIEAQDVTVADIDGTSKKIATITNAAGKAFFVHDFLKNSEGGKAGYEVTDIGTPQSPAFETVLTATLKGQDAAQVEYYRQMRAKGRLVCVPILNTGQNMVIGDESTPAILRKMNVKGGKDIEEPNTVELEFYWKSTTGPIETSVTRATLLTEGA